MSGDTERCYLGKYTGPPEFPMPWQVGSFMKEPSYFSRFYKIMKFRDYCSFFDNNGTGKLSFDASPEYFDMVGVEERVKQECPDSKFIVLLRNPIKRAWSHYWHEVLNNKSENLPFMEAIQRSGPCYCNVYFYSYLRRGHYAEHLERWFSLFPREQFKVYIMEEFYSDTRNWGAIQAWLGLRTRVRIEQWPYNTTLTKGYPRITEDVESYLRGYYKPHNHNLKELLEIEELPW